MSKIRVGNKINSFWNGIWASHARPFGKKYGNRRRRRILKQTIQNELDNVN